MSLRHPLLLALLALTLATTSPTLRADDPSPPGVAAAQPAPEAVVILPVTRHDPAEVVQVLETLLAPRPVTIRAIPFVRCVVVAGDRPAVALAQRIVEEMERTKQQQPVRPWVAATPPGS